MEWAIISEALYLRHTRGLSDAERGVYMDRTLAAITDNRTGETTLADAMLDEANAFVEAKRRAGKLGGLAKARNRRDRELAKDTPSTASDPVAPRSTPSKPLANVADPSKASTATEKLAPPSHNTTQQNITEHNTQPIHPDPTRAHAREAGEKPPQAAIPHSAAPARPVGAAKAANPPQHPPQPAPPPETPPAARNAVDGKPSGSGGGSRTGNGSAKPTPSGKAKSPFSWADLSEDKQRYVWTIAPTLLPQFAVWFCQEPDNEKAKAIYEKFCARFGAEPFRILLDKFVASVFAGEEPDNRGAAFMATVMAEGRGRQAELAKTGNKPNQTNKQNNQNKGENK